LTAIPATLFDDPAPAEKSAMPLRPYQDEAVKSIDDALERSDSTLCVMPTGTGKTVVFSHVIKMYRDLARRVVVLAHRDELIRQAAAKILTITGKEPQIEKADEVANPAAGIVVSSIQTQISRRNDRYRMEKFDPHRVGLVVIDEAHHACAASYRKVINHYRQNARCKILGVTATPDRADEEALGQVFDTVAFEYQIQDAINDGWLVPIRQSIVDVEGLDYSMVRTTAGDLNGKDLAGVLESEKILHGFAGPTIDIAGDRKTLVFASSVAHAERLCEIFNRHRPGQARFVCGATPEDERRQIIQSYASGDFQFLTNVGVFTEGFDDPSVEVVVMARPTKSRSLYAQCVGRGTRPLPGIFNPSMSEADRQQAILSSIKPYCEVVDFAGNAGRHKLVHPADILGGNYSDEVVDLARETAEQKAKTGEPVDVSGELRSAEREIHERHKRAERKRRAHIKAKATYRKRSVDPFDVLDIEPSREPAYAKGRKPTPEIIKTLEKFGVQDPEKMTFTQARQLRSELIQRVKGGLATWKQARVLKKYGIDAKDMTFEQASQRIDKIAKNGWKA
jgi:superfamily II DNA or RNA helicase